MSSLGSPQFVDSIVCVLLFRDELSLPLRSPPSRSIAFSLLVETSSLSPSLSGTDHSVPFCFSSFSRSLILSLSLVLPSLKPIDSLFGSSHFSGLFSLPLLLSQIPVFCSLGVTLMVPLEDSFEVSETHSRILSVFSFLASSYLFPSTLK